MGWTGNRSGSLMEAERFVKAVLEPWPPADPHDLSQNVSFY
jgi:hypothetical protein